MPEQPSTDSEIEGRLAAVFGGSPAPAPQVQAAPETPQAAQVDATSDTTTEVAEAESETEQVEDDGNDDFEVDEGTTIRVPREVKAKISEWKEGHIRRDDYTRKTQVLADITRQAQLTAEAIQTRQQFETEVTKERTEYARVAAELEQYKGLNWGELDVNQYIKLKGQMDQLKDRAEELKGALNSKAQEFQAKLDTNKKKVIEEGKKFLQKVAPNLTAESMPAIRSAAMELGFTEGELDNVYDARFVALAWKAAQFDKLQTAKSSAVASVQKAPPVVKPGAGTGQLASKERQYKDARASMKKNGNDLNAMARVFLMRGSK